MPEMQVTILEGKKVKKSKEEGMMTKDPKVLLAAAENEEEREKRGRGGLLAKDYIDSIHELRKKNWTWKEIREWFADQGVPLSDSTLMATYRKATGGGKAKPRKRTKLARAVEGE